MDHGPRPGLGTAWLLAGQALRDSTARPDRPYSGWRTISGTLICALREALAAKWAAGCVR